MDEKLMPNEFITGDAKVSANPQYLQWIESVKGRYRQSQIKAHLQVNAAVLELTFGLPPTRLGQTSKLDGARCSVGSTGIWGTTSARSCARASGAVESSIR